MYVFYIISICMLIMSYVLMGSSGNREGDSYQDADIEVGQMIMYHDAAVKACKADPPYCANLRGIARSRVVAQIEGVVSNGPAYGSNALFRSFSDGNDQVFTTAVPALAATSQVGTHAWDSQDDNIRERFNEHNVILRRRAFTKYYAGPFDRSSRRLTNAEGETTTIPRNIPSAGITIMPDAPVIVSEWTRPTSP